jgi:4'-phosphopantetheinyl transferase
LSAATWPVGPAQPTDPAAEVHVWRAQLDAGAPGEGWELPAAERRRAAQMRRPGSGARWIAARRALRTVLGRYLDEDPAAIALRAGPHGKPELTAPGRLEFNLSHSGTLALIAVTIGVELGIDLEKMDPGRDFLALAERGLGPDAVAALRAMEPAGRPHAFYEQWVRHEALLKCRGGGLGRPAPEEPVTVRDLQVDRDYAAALAVGDENALPLRCFSLVLARP